MTHAQRVNHWNGDYGCSDYCSENNTHPDDPKPGDLTNCGVCGGAFHPCRDGCLYDAASEADARDRDDYKL